MPWAAEGGGQQPAGSGHKRSAKTNRRMSLARDTFLADIFGCAIRVVSRAPREPKWASARSEQMHLLFI